MFGCVLLAGLAGVRQVCVGYNYSPQPNKKQVHVGKKLKANFTARTLFHLLPVLWHLHYRKY